MDTCALVLYRLSILVLQSGGQPINQPTNQPNQPINHPTNQSTNQRWLLRRPIGLCGLVVSVADYKHRGPGFDSRALLRIFLRELGLDGGPLSLVIG
jgi:hypothetical protein